MKKYWNHRHSHEAATTTSKNSVSAPTKGLIVACWNMKSQRATQDLCVWLIQARFGQKLQPGDPLRHANLKATVYPPYDSLPFLSSEPTPICRCFIYSRSYPMAMFPTYPNIGWREKYHVLPLYLSVKTMASTIPFPCEPLLCLNLLESHCLVVSSPIDVKWTLKFCMMFQGFHNFPWFSMFFFSAVFHPSLDCRVGSPFESWVSARGKR